MGRETTMEMWRMEAGFEQGGVHLLRSSSLINNLKSETLTSGMLNGERRLHLLQSAARGKAKLVAFQHWGILFMTTSKIAT